MGSHRRLRKAGKQWRDVGAALALGETAFCHPVYRGVHNPEDSGHQGTGSGQKIVLLFGLAFDCRAKGGKESSGLSVWREDGRHALAVRDERQWNGLDKVNVFPDPLEKRLSVGRRNDADNRLPIAERQSPQDVLGNLRTHCQDDDVTRVDHALVVGSNRDFRELTCWFRFR